MRMGDDTQDEASRALERGRQFARIVLLEWKLSQIYEITAGLTGDMTAEDSFNLGRIEELSK